MTSAQSITALGRRLRILRRPSTPVLPGAPRPARRDCHGRLHKALEALAGPEGTVTACGIKPWCSATFVGAQHRFAIELPAHLNPEALARALANHEFRIPGHVVADLAVDATSAEGSMTRLQLCVLTIEDW